MPSDSPCFTVTSPCGLVFRTDHVLSHQERLEIIQAVGNQKRGSWTSWCTALAIYGGICTIKMSMLAYARYLEYRQAQISGAHPTTGSPSAPLTSSATIYADIHRAAGI